VAEETSKLPARVLLLHRFDEGEVEHFASKLLIPHLCQHAAAFRIRQAGNDPGEAGYWLHLFHLLSGIVDAVVTVQVASEPYSESIFFEQVLLPQLSHGKTLRSKLFEANDSDRIHPPEILNVPLLTITLFDCPHAEFFVWLDPERHNIVIDIQCTSPEELISILSSELARFFAKVSIHTKHYGAVVPAIKRREECIFWSLVRHPLVAAALTMDAAVLDGPALQQRANAHDVAQQAADKVADQLLHDADALAWWARMSRVVSARALPRTAADKIAAVQAKKWQWIVRLNSHSKLHIFAYSLARRLANRIQVLRYRWRA
jgi:hypothetical protein